MNNKQALKHLAHMATNCLEGVQKGNIVAHKQIEALNIGIQALQEKLERDKGCEYCMPDKNCKVCKWTRLCNGKIKDNRCTARDYKFESDDYCKFCGRKLVE